MKYCKKCVQPDTRPGVKFGNDGVCMACRYEENTSTIDWQARKVELGEIINFAKDNNHGRHDCVIGISGGKDSTFQAMYARDVLGLNPLLVNLAPDQITEAGAKNIENLIQLGFDTMMLRPNPKVWKKLIKRAFYEFGNPVKPTEYPLWAVSYITAVKFNIPLVIQGENPGITLGVTDGVGDDGNALNIKENNTVSGCNASDWFDEELGLNDLLWYQFPTNEELQNANVKAIYLQYYEPNWSVNYNTEFSKKLGLSCREGHTVEATGRLNKYSSVDSDMQIVNQMIKYYKFGFGFITDEVCYDIREGLMTREQGIDLVKRYDGACDERYIMEFCDYVDISLPEFNRVLDSYVNKDLFKKVDGKWHPKFEPGVDFE